MAIGVALLLALGVQAKGGPEDIKLLGTVVQIDVPAGVPSSGWGLQLPKKGGGGKVIAMEFMPGVVVPVGARFVKVEGYLTTVNGQRVLLVKEIERIGLKS